MSSISSCDITKRRFFVSSLSLNFQWSLSQGGGGAGADAGAGKGKDDDDDGGGGGVVLVPQPLLATSVMLAPTKGRVMAMMMMAVLMVKRRRILTWVGTGVGSRVFLRRGPGPAVESKMRRSLSFGPATATPVPRGAAQRQVRPLIARVAGCGHDGRVEG